MKIIALFVGHLLITTYISNKFCQYNVLTSLTAVNRNDDKHNIKHTISVFT